MLEIDKILQLKEEYILYKLDVGDGKFWLFNIENGDSFKLNRTSYDMLSLIDGKRNIEEINRCLFDKYSDKNKDLILNDFEELIERMRKEKIIEERR
jgi:methyltransferase-like protein